MYLSGIFLGYSVFEHVNATAATPVAYARIKFLGNCTIDNVHIVNEVLTDAEIDAKVITANDTWTNTTLALATFESGSIGAGNITNLNEALVGWDVYRKVVGETTLTKVGTVDPTETHIIDYFTQANKNYQYVIYPFTTNQLGEPILSNEILADYYGWYLIGTDDDDTIYVYNFDLNLDFKGYDYAEDFNEYETYTKYNAFSKGSRNFIKGSITAIAGDLDTSDQFDQTIDYLDDMKDRIQSISTKTIKSRKGELYNVKTHALKITPLENKLHSQPYMIEFQFIQCAD
jgi:hypothetical protein